MPRVFGLPHLSEDAVAAFADGVLSASAAQRARRHCAECAECAEAVRVQREAAMMLRSADAPSLPSGLMARLAGLADTTPIPPSSRPPTAIGPDGVPVFVSFSTAKPRVDPAPEVHHSTHPHAEGWLSLSGLRRTVIPVGALASAAAVVAVGALGAQLVAGSNQHLPANPGANLVGAVTSTDDGHTGTSATPGGSATTMPTASPTASPTSAPVLPRTAPITPTATGH